MNRRKYFNTWRKNLRQNLVEKGLCSNDCGRKLIIKWYCRECADKINQYARNHYWKNHEHNKARKKYLLNKYRYSGLRELVEERDKKVCQVCYYPKILIHHIDENPKNNTMENLICLCRICHSVVERMNKSRPNLHNLFPWLRRYELP